MASSKTYIIAEAGVNHNGSMALARELIDAAKSAGADAVKFQAFKTGKLASASAQKAAYQKSTTGDGTQKEMLSKLELTPDNFRELKSYASEKRIEFLASAFDEESLALVVSLGVSRLKLGSGELTNGPMLYASAKTGLPLIVSTGMGTIAEIKEALSLLAQTYLAPGALPNKRMWNAAYSSDSGQKLLRDRVTLLHCTTEYPCPMDQVDLRAMDQLVSEFHLPVGYSDHTEGIAVSLAAAARGACIIEKHLTTSRNLPGPDHKASIEPAEFEQMVKGIREIESALGREEKFVHSVEMQNMGIARRSLIAQREIAAGEVFTLENIASRRPGTGISPMRLWDLLGQKATRAYSEGAFITEDELKSS